MMTSTFSPMASSVAASSRPMLRRSARLGMWTLAFGHHEDRTPTHGYEPTVCIGNAGRVAHQAAGSEIIG
jgi:hypothetical protein